jgi:hypothetical protein
MPKLSFYASQDINAGDVVVVLSGTGRIAKASANGSLNDSCIGIALYTTPSGGLVVVNNDEPYLNLSGLTPGQNVYVAFSSGFIAPTYSDWVSSVSGTSAATVNLISLGRALTTSGITNQITRPVVVTVSGL